MELLSFRDAGVHIAWWPIHDDYAVKITDRRSGLSVLSTHEVFADALADAYRRLASAIFAQWDGETHPI